MSEFSYIPPPSPPGPPPAEKTFDFVKPFTFLFQDAGWLNKVLLGGLFYLAIVVIVGIFFVLGYLARLARNVVAGMEQPAPEWDDLGEYFGEGLMLAGVVLVYVIPFVVLAGAVFIPAGILGALSNGHDLANVFAGGVVSCAACLIMPASLAMSFWLPQALLLASVDRRFGAAFEFGRIWRSISGNIGNYLLAFVVYLVARFAAGMGLMLLCIGVFFTAFWAMVVATYAFAQAYRMSPSR